LRFRNFNLIQRNIVSKKIVNRMQACWPACDFIGLVEHQKIVLLDLKSGLAILKQEQLEQRLVYP